MDSFFGQGTTLNLRLMAAVLASLSLLAIDQRYPHLNSFRSSLSLLTSPVQYLVSLPIDFNHYVHEQFTSHHTLIIENKRLRQEHLSLKTQQLKFSALEKENDRLRSLLETSFKLGELVLIAELISVNLDPYQHTVLLNKGSRFSVFKGQPVIDANGIAGQVIRANPLNSEVMLITDPSHAIPVQVNRNGLRTIAVGSGLINQLNLPFLPNNVDIQKDDLLVASGLGGIFPQGYPVAYVTEVTPIPGQPFSQIRARPAAELDRSRELLLVWSHNNPVPLLPALPDNDADAPINQNTEIPS